MKKIRKMNEVYKLLSFSERETVSFGKQIGKLISSSICMLFYGELGSGKTVFIRGVCEALGIESRIVRSPSFTLVNEYKGILPVAHADLYRLEGDKKAVKSLFLGEYIDEGYVLLVEWAQNGDFDLENTISIVIETDNDDREMRKFLFSARGDNASSVLSEFTRAGQE